MTDHADQHTLLYPVRAHLLQLVIGLAERAGLQWRRSALDESPLSPVLVLTEVMLWDRPLQEWVQFKTRLDRGVMYLDWDGVVVGHSYTLDLASPNLEREFKQAVCDACPVLEGKPGGES